MVDLRPNIIKRSERFTCGLGIDYYVVRTNHQHFILGSVSQWMAFVCSPCMVAGVIRCPKKTDQRLIAAMSLNPCLTCG